MVYQFKAWDAQIADITTRPEYQNIAIKLIDPTLVVETYDIATGITTVTNDGKFFTGPARLIAIRAGINRENTETTNSSTVTHIRIQFPRNQNFGTEMAPIYRIRRGIKLMVTSAPNNKALETMIFTCTSDLQGGSVASRTLEFSTDGDLVV